MGGTATKRDFSNVGIGVITYNRSAFLLKCLDTLHASALNGAKVAVFDDCSTDDSVAVARRYGEVFSPRENGGVVRNKNRALYYFTEVNPREVILLVEDDILIGDPGWLAEWVDATLAHGHINFTHPGFMAPDLKDHFISGSGTAADPHVFTLVTGQCSGVLSALIRQDCGYLDPAFQGYGYGHVEWTKRLLAKGQGGHMVDGKACFLSITGGIIVPAAPSFRNDEQLNRNRDLFEQAARQGFDRFVALPWQTEAERITHFVEPFGPEGAVPRQPGPQVGNPSGKTLTSEVNMGGDKVERPKTVLPPDVAEFLEQTYRRATTILEYGSGGSTALAAEMPGTTVFSVESDRDWVAMLRKWFAQNPPRGKVHLIHADIGPTRDWGHPRDESRRLHWIDYPLAVWERPDLVHPDVVLIDGRFRVGCFLATLMNIRRPTTILFDDYGDRPQYHVVEDLLPATRHVGRMAVFEARPRALHPSELRRYGAYFFRPE